MARRMLGTKDEICKTRSKYIKEKIRNDGDRDMAIGTVG